MILIAATGLRLAAQPMVLDPGFAPRVDSGESIITSVRYAPAPNGQLLVFGYEGGFYAGDLRSRSGLFRLLADGSVDPTLATRIDPAVDETVLDAVAWPDGRILVSTRVNQISPTPVRVVRLLSNGVVDPTFTPSSYVEVLGLTLARDGSAFVWGHLGDRRTIVRLQADGMVDPAFSAPDFPGGMYGPPGVSSLVVAPDDSLLIRLNPGTSRFFGEQLYRLKATGGIDSTFVAPNAFGEGGFLVGVDPQNRVLVTTGSGLRRLNSNGSVDPAFNVNLPGARSVGYAILLTDGRIVVEARIVVAEREVPNVFILQPNGAIERDCRSLAGAQRMQRLLGRTTDGRVVIAQGLPVRKPENDLVRLTMHEPSLAIVDPAVGTLTVWPTAIDSSFPAPVTRLSLDASGRILVEGDFNRIAGVRRPGLARFNADRTLDSSFAPIDAKPLFHLPDGRIIARRTILGTADADGIRAYITKVVRLSADGSVDPTFVATEAVNLVDATWLVVAADGHILVVENAAGPDSTWRLVWLAPNGSLASVLATTFPRVYVQPGQPAWKNVEHAAILPDGKLLLGVLGEINGLLTRAPVRLNADGSTDTSYQPNIAALPNATRSIPLPDGRAYVIGPYYYPFTEPAQVLRLNADGSPDTFVPPALAEGVRLDDGSYLYRNERYHADGTRDLNFSFPGVVFPEVEYAYSLRAAVLANDGSIWIGGTFGDVQDQPEQSYPRTNLARLVPVEVEGFTVPPANTEVYAGFEATLQAELGTAAPATFQWTRNGTPIPGANQRTLQIKFAGAEDAGEYRLVASVGDKTHASAPAVLTVKRNDTRVVNFSARSAVAPGYPPQIGGFVLRGDAPRRVLLRAIGRGLPVNDPGFTLLPQPALTLFEGSRVVMRDAGGALAPAIVAAGVPLGAAAVRSEFPPGEPTRDSALLLPLPPGIYTAHTSSLDGREGISLFEFYDADPTNPISAVANVSVRGRAAPGHDVLIAGFVVNGSSGALRVLIRGIGPALAGLGVAGAVANPQITLYDQTQPIAANDDWSAQVDVADVVSAAERVGAFALPRNSRDAALLITLPSQPGIYTVHGRSVDSTAGEMLIELYVVE